MYKFYWYPKCSTCQKAKKWLDQKEIPYEAVDMISTDQPSKEDFLRWMVANDWERSRYFNTSGNIYRDENLKATVYDVSNEKAAEMLAERGMLVKRPILENNDQILFGWNEKNYQTFTGVE